MLKADEPVELGRFATGAVAAFPADAYHSVGFNPGLSRFAVVLKVLLVTREVRVVAEPGVLRYGDVLGGREQAKVRFSSEPPATTSAPLTPGTVTTVILAQSDPCRSVEARTLSSSSAALAQERVARGDVWISPGRELSWLEVRRALGDAVHGCGGALVGTDCLTYQTLLDRYDELRRTLAGN